MICSNKDITCLFEEHVSQIQEWMETHYTDPALSSLAVDYLRDRSKRQFVNLDTPDHIRRLSQAQDPIESRNFTEGKLSKSFRVIQQDHLKQQETRVTVDSWLKGFVSKLLAMTHSQWLFRCITKHYRLKGTLLLARKEDLLKEIERQLDMGVDTIANEDRWMLEVDVDQLRNTSLSEKQYWIHAVEAAQQAGSRALKLAEGVSCSWADILQNGKSEHLPTTTPIPSE